LARNRLSNVYEAADEKTHSRPLKRQTDRAKMQVPRIAGTRLDNLEVKASYHPGGVGYFQGARGKVRALHFDVIDTRPTRRAALTIGGRHDR
jgi:hypothetical protein